MNSTLWNKNFILVLIGQIISLFGNAILRFALPLYLLNETGSAALFGVVSASAFLPMLLLTPIGGIIADRVNKRNIMVILDFFTAFLVLAFGFSLHRMNLVLLISIALILLYAIQGIYQPTVQASIPFLVPQQSIMQANAMVNLVNSVSSLIGPVIGGTLFAGFGITPILSVSGGCFFFSAVMEIFIRIPLEKKESSCGIIKTGYSDLRSSLRFILKEKPEILKISLIIAGINLFLTSCAMIGIPSVIMMHMGFAAENANRFYGYTQGFMGAGSLLGGILAGALAAKVKAHNSPLTFFLCGATLLPMAAALSLPVSHNMSCILILAGSFLMMTFAAFLSIQFMSYLQLLTPSDIVGKVISCAMCIGMCATPVGQAVYGVLFEKFASAPELLFLSSFAIVAVISLLSVRTFASLEVTLAPKQEPPSNTTLAFDKKEIV